MTGSIATAQLWARNLVGYTLLAMAIAWAASLLLVGSPQKCQSMLRPVLRAALRCFGLRIELRGHLAARSGSKGHWIFCNHLSMLDHLVLLTVWPRHLVGIEKIETASIPVYGWAARRWGQIFIERAATWSAGEAYLEARDRLAAGSDVVVFPEGTRSRDGRLRSLRPLSFQVALESGQPLIPVRLAGLFEVCPRGSKLIRAGRVEVCVGEPIMLCKPELNRDALIQAVQQALDPSSPQPN